MEFVETPIFTKLVQATLSAEEYRAFQLYLALRPDCGDVIAGSGGLRKIRWRLANRGKRGGVRVVYYWKSATSQVFLLFLYPKNVRSGLSLPELRTLRNLVNDV